MSVVEQSIPVVPDAVEAVEGWRRWSFDGKVLRAVAQPVGWLPGQPMEAGCMAGSMRYQWVFERRGLTLEQAREQAAEHNQTRGLFGGRSRLPWIPAPTVVTPDDYGYKLVEITHDAPDEGCTCGIYAATDLSICPSGEVSGKVKLWGKVVPGERGWRAQYAYPSELHVPAKLANHRALLAYGVPIVVTDDPPDTPALAAAASSQSRWLPSHGRFLYYGVVGINLAAGAFNVVTAALR